MKLWFDDNKHVLGTVGMCILIMQVRGPQGLTAPQLEKSEHPEVPLLAQAGGGRRSALLLRSAGGPSSHAHPASQGLSPWVG